jgi:SpoVK/Ycf46/Vps4 family AAA+-type ATPase
MTDIKPLEEYTFKELQELATSKGIAGAEVFTTKAQLITLINNFASIPREVNSIDPVEESNIKEKHTSKKEAMRKYLESRPKVRFMIPLDLGEKPGAIESWCENGYKIEIEKGVFQDVPDVIAEILARRYQLTMDAGKAWDINRINPDTGRPMREGL